MRKKKKDEIGMCQKQRNTCEKRKKDEIGMCQRQRNTCEKRKKMKQVCARGKGIHVRKGKIEIK